MIYNFKGCIAVVTGGLNGIGAAIAAALRAAQAETVVWDRAAVKPEDYRVDITDASSIEAAISSLPRLDILVNNAGYAGPTMPLEDYPPEEWRRIVDINLVGTFNVCRAAVPLMRRSGGRGRIVNIASLAGKEGTPNASAYSAAKAGIIALTKSLGKELANSGILVNAVAPAAVRTDLLEQMSASHVQEMISKSPMKRLIEPQEVAEIVMWLSSEACTANTGAIFDLSAGRATY